MASTRIGAEQQLAQDGQGYSKACKHAHKKVLKYRKWTVLVPLHPRKGHGQAIQHYKLPSSGMRSRPGLKQNINTHEANNIPLEELQWTQPDHINNTTSLVHCTIYTSETACSYSTCNFVCTN